jgi:hypothetical protein
MPRAVTVFLGGMNLMWTDLWRQWLDRTFGLTRTPALRRTIPLRLERLEDRWLPSTSATGQAVSFTEGASKTVVAATFTDTTPNPPQDYTATINWGDGTLK